jgi:hypothetical protein
MKSLKRKLTPSSCKYWLKFSRKAEAHALHAKLSNRLWEKGDCRKKLTAGNSFDPSQDEASLNGGACGCQSTSEITNCCLAQNENNKSQTPDSSQSPSSLSNSRLNICFARDVAISLISSSNSVSIFIFNVALCSVRKCFLQ